MYTRAIFLPDTIELDLVNYMNRRCHLFKEVFIKTGENEYSAETPRDCTFFGFRIVEKAIEYLYNTDNDFCPREWFYEIVLDKMQLPAPREIGLFPTNSIFNIDDEIEGWLVKSYASPNICHIFKFKGA